MTFALQYQNHLKKTEIVSLIHDHQKNQNLFIGYKDLKLTIQEATENIVCAAGFKSAKDICGLCDHELPYPSLLMAAEYIYQDRKVLQGKKLTIFDILPLKDTHVLTITTRVPVTNNQFNIIGSSFFMNRVTSDSSMHALAKLIMRDKKKLGASLILNEENILSAGDEKYNLSKKEFEVLWLLCRGLSIKKIAAFMHRSPRTIEDYINAIKYKKACNQKSEFIEHAISQGILNYLPIGLAFDKNIEGLFQ